MSRKYYIAADGGGTKLEGILYDEDFNLIKSARSGGVNSTFMSVDMVKGHIDEMLSELLGDDTFDVNAMDACMVCPASLWQETVKNFGRVKETRVHSESAVALGAAFHSSGMVVLSGTGSGLIFNKDGKDIAHAGGMGPMLGDEGSGYDIGVNAIKAATYSFDGRGEKTALEEMILEKWDAKHPLDIVDSLSKEKEPRKSVASVTRLVSKAAEGGDKTAIRLFEDAADALFLHFKALYKKCEALGWDGTVVVSGGTWKASPIMYKRFKDKVLSLYPSANVERIRFEPMIGAAVCRCLRDGMPSEKIRSAVSEKFNDYLIKG